MAVFAAAEALWLGAPVKFRVILMTSLAVIFGAIPQIYDPFAIKSSMGAVIVGGMLSSIFFTLVLIPVLFLLLCRAQAFIGSATILPPGSARRRF